MDFVAGLLVTSCGYDSVWVIMDRLTKSTYFLAVKIRYSVGDYVRLFLREIVHLHGVLMVIIFYQ